ncbi:MAG: divergent polysaccharide deacetylase family protein [Alphaproteobacteria bacterium]|nr:divergent polysaccharide deacetylase family protein [Alphaproteobacteria bacterium]MDE2336083.1 divergent polysaccharide deacetylase family protein [Alphaproteobacteria bacterium]
MKKILLGLCLAFGLAIPALASVPQKAVTETHPRRPMIAIDIDDMGVAFDRSLWALDLPRAVTFAYLPYADHLLWQVAAARAGGHEVILHIPMEANDPDEYPGPHNLSVDMTKEQLERNIKINLDSFVGYDGVNNHMGSRFTTYATGLKVLMELLAKRDIYFMDSMTTPKSVAFNVAREYHIPAVRRDVFLDDTDTAAGVARQINETEKLARRYGAVIAIGHPKPATLAALEVWLPTLKARGFDLVPVSTVVRYRNHEALPRHVEDAGR